MRRQTIVFALTLFAAFSFRLFADTALVAPILRVEPGTALIDLPVKITASGLPPNELVKITAVMRLDESTGAI